MFRRIGIALGGVIGIACGMASAASVTGFSPQGEVAQVRQVRASFSEPMVALGSAEAPAPFAIECPEPGSGRWADARTWIYDLRRDLPPGVRCSFMLRPDLRALSGAAISGASRFAFETGGPAVLRANPWIGSDQIDEEQVFVLTLSGPATEASVRAGTWCEAEHLGERIPTSVIKGSDRDALIARLRLDKQAERVVMLQCQRRLQNGVKMSLVWGRGIQTATGIATTREQRLAYTVRRPFEAGFTCERENAQAPCVPVRPAGLEFSSPVARALAERIVLRMAGQTLRPRWRRDDRQDAVRRVEFPAPLPESSEGTIELPANFRDEDGRALANAGSFPLLVRTGGAPPLAKFPGTFGIVEAGAEALLPVTVRSVDPQLSVSTLGALPLASVRADSDAEVIAWLKKLHGRGFDFEKPEGCEHDDGAEQRTRPAAECRQAREVSLLAGEARAERRALPLPEAGRSFEVVGIPFARRGYHVVEIESPALGVALLGRAAPMYVRASALVTNLAVHFKLGRENALAWVTSLDAGKPVAGAEVRVSDCEGAELWRGRTDREGLARLPAAPQPRGQCQPQGPGGWGEPALFVSARTGEDYAFVLSNWNAGIERWRFGVPTAWGGDAAVRAHTVFDRTLLRAGETVSMKHLIRRESMSGFAPVPQGLLPDQLLIRHLGSGQEFRQPLEWRDGSATSRHAIPLEAKLGEYEVILTRAPRRGSPGPAARGETEAPPDLASGSFRVSEFRLPTMEGRLVAPKAGQVGVSELAYEIQLNYVSGGPAAGHDVAVSSVLRTREVAFPGYERFRFAVIPPAREARDEAEPREKLVADRIAVKLDRNGAGRVTLRELPPSAGPQMLRTEASFFDPNGERLTVSASTPLWPSAVVVGIRTDGWVSAGRKASVSLVVLDTSGQPVARAPVEVSAQSQVTVSHRRRLVGGFYAYEHRTEREPLGIVCKGFSDERGRLACEVELGRPGNVILSAVASDADGRSARADASLWVTGQGEVWFDAESQDRMDLVPEKPRYEPGERARFQVRTPFRHATVLLAVEREGVIETFVRELSGRDPTVEIPVKAEYGPNAFVSALAVRGRLREVPWYSIFTWGWRSPVEWWHAWREWREKGAPGAMVDLAKPAFKLGVAEIRVGLASRELKVAVTPEHETYRIREKAGVRVRVRMPDGRPAPAGTQIAFAAVDQALLELQPNQSWNLLEAMYPRRGHGVDTATAQMQVIGKRHYGRKAVAHGGGGGRGPGRELFDTLLLWAPRVQLDARGEATLEVPINDSLTRFALVAIADAGTDLFGTGTGSLRVVQDLQILSGLPPLVRSGDAYDAGITLRNTTERAMRVKLEARAGEEKLPARTLDLPAGAAREASWRVRVPEGGEDSALAWTISAREEGGPASDALTIAQKRVARVPVTAQQATLLQVKGSAATAVAPPAGALPGRGGLAIALRPRLGVTPPGVLEYFESYPLVCLEQKVSRAAGLRDAALWQSVMDRLPAYLDGDGLARYFPGEQPGSDALTAYLLAVAHESGFAIPEAERERMLAGLAAFADGRVERRFWSPRPDLDARKLAAAEALARYGRASARALESMALEPNALPTGALVDWIAILRRVTSIPERAARLERAEQVLRARLDFTGTRLGFSTEAQDHWWWLMGNADVNAAKLILAVMDSPAWREDLPALATGLLGRQSRGRWMTTTANVWGALALERFGAAFEKDGVSGRTTATLDKPHAASSGHDWKARAGGGVLSLPWGSMSSDSPGGLRIAHAGGGAPWATIRSLAAVPASAAKSAGYAIARAVTPIEQKQPGMLTRGDIVRVRLEIDARSDMTWVVVSDPVPGGASILGTGLGRDSQIAARGEKREGRAWPAFEEKGLEGFRAYYEFVPKGRWSLEYTLRLNNAGTFGLPPTRVEAMYAPEMFGELPNADVTVRP